MTSRWKGKKSPPEVAGVNASGLKLISLNATHIIFQCYTVSIMRAESLQCNVKRYVRPVASMKAAVSSEVQTGLLQMECHLQSRPRRWRRREVVPRSYVPFSQLVSWWEERQPAEGGGADTDPLLTPSAWQGSRGCLVFCRERSALVGIPLGSNDDDTNQVMIVVFCIQTSKCVFKTNYWFGLLDNSPGAHDPGNVGHN